MAMMAPALDMMRRGLLVDMNERAKYIKELEELIARLEKNFHKLTVAICGLEINPRSPGRDGQVGKLFYDYMGLNVVWTNKQGKRVASMDRKTLEKLRLYYDAKLLVNYILRIRELGKMLGVMRSQVDPDNRMRTSYNVSGTETARWSSSSNAWGRGTNFQNITERARRVFVSPRRRKMAYIDMEQAESRLVAARCRALTGKRNYWDACHSGDLHTHTCRLIWKDLEWIGDKKADRAIAEDKFYRHFSRRDVSKRCGHGSNYDGTAKGIADVVGIDRDLVQGFQISYFDEFPEIKEWHEWVPKQLAEKGHIITALGRKRNFWGRHRDHETIKEAIAFEPQSVVAEVLNLGMWKVWKYGRGLVSLLAQVHDAILVEYDEDREDEALQFCLDQFRSIHIPFGDFSLTIPPNVEGTGYNWGKTVFDRKTGEILDNPDGLQPHKPGQIRSRINYPPESIMDRVIV